MSKSKKSKFSDDIFSGENSRELWSKIHNIFTFDDCRWTLYLLCCKLQELETKLRKIERKMTNV